MGKKKTQDKEVPAEPVEDLSSDEELREEMAEAAGEDVAATAAGGDVLVFGKWPTSVEIRDKGLERYINLRPQVIPHTGGMYSKRRFWKHKASIVERLANRIMTPGSIKARVKGRRSSNRSGKKQKALNIIRRAFELAHLKTGENPLQLLVRAIENSAPREDTTRISMGGISYQSSVDVAPSRRVDIALHFLALGATRRSYNTPMTIEEYLSDEIVAAAKADQASFAVARKEEKERIAASAR